MESAPVAENVEAARRTAQYLAFTLGNATYGFPVECVREVVEYTSVFRIPRVPEHVHGVINLRGEVMPVIDLSHVFYGKKASITASSGIVFVEAGHMGETVVLGVLIDSVEAVTDIAEDDIDESPAFGHQINPEFIQGIGKVGDRFIIILNVARALDVQVLSRFGAEKVIK